MSLPSVLLLFGGSACVGVGLFVGSYQLASVAPLPRPAHGPRGWHRAQALTRPGFRWVEPAIRRVGRWCSSLPRAGFGVRVERLIRCSGEVLGLSADELVASSLLLASFLGLAGCAACHALALPPVLAWVAGMFGLWLPFGRLSQLVRSRAATVNRGLPRAIELLSLCMSAGLDFPGSVEMFVRTRAGSTDPLVEELSRVLHELELGHTRKRALQGLAHRVPTPQVGELVAAIVQSEQRGNPLAQVLEIQAQTQELRRSVAAEEAASGAALLLVGPMTLIFLCVIVLVTGPLVIRFVTGELSVG